MNSLFTRRWFMKAATLASGAVIGTPALSSCASSGRTGDPCRSEWPKVSIPGFDSSRGPAGLLFSQIGYEPGMPVRIILRLPQKELLSEGSICRLKPLCGGSEHQTGFIYWGELWKSHWWIADLAGFDEEGEWQVSAEFEGNSLFEDRGFICRKNRLRDQTLALAAADMLERRVHFIKAGAGWQDAGTLWAESPAQSAMIIALTELAEHGSGQIEAELMDRIEKQITVGSDYLVMTQEKARQLGYAVGAMSHDLLGHEHNIIPADVAKAVVALSRASRLLPGKWKEKKEAYFNSARLAFDWLQKRAIPMGNYGYSLFQRGLSEGTVVPKNEWMTRDLVTLCWASLELFRSGVEEAREAAVGYAGQILSRQIPRAKAESGFYGHFYEFPGLSHSEPSWSHGIPNNEFGADVGGIYPHYLMPLLEMLRLWPNHADAPQWKETLGQFAAGFLIPACRRNPFLIMPQGIFREEGPIWFCGTFHGTNTIYGYTAALAAELSRFLNNPELMRIAWGNMQWIAGLNVGITRETMQACVVYSRDLPEGLALPVSMMHGVGNRWAGGWFATRGVICNGFSTGKQFVYDTLPLRINDGPFSLTDEDWIPHSAAWLTGLIRVSMNLPVNDNV